MTARAHLLWVQELLESRGFAVLVDDATPGQLTFTRGARSRSYTCAELISINVNTLADTLQAELAP